MKIIKNKNYLLLITSLVLAGKTLANSVLVTPATVAEMVLKQSTKTLEINEKYQQLRLAPASVLGNFDWKLTIESGFESDKTASLQTSDTKYDRYKTSLNLTKPFLTGTLLGVNYTRLSQKSEFGTFSSASSSIPPEATLDVMTVSVEQALWWNAFGEADRAAINSSQMAFNSQNLLRADELQNLVLDSLRQYWNTFVAQENFKEAMASKERYKKLVATVQRKSGFGYTSPGELSQIQAELEGREQTIRSASVDYLLNLENLVLLLNLPKGTNLDFPQKLELPAVPSLSDINLERLRPIRSQKLKLKAAEESYSSIDSKSHPALNLVGLIGTSGSDTSPESSLSKFSSGNNPRAYLGLKFYYYFGADTQSEELINKKSVLTVEKLKLDRQLLELKDKESQAIRKVQAFYGIAESSLRQKDLREKTVEELTRSYNQGRTDLRNLIDAMNAYFATQVTSSRAIGNYQIALNEWAALRDELIPESNEETTLSHMSK